MNTQTIKKRIGVIFALLCIILMAVFCISRYGWKLLGFKYCADPSIIHVDNITIDSNEDFVKLSGNTSASAPAFVGFTYKSEGNVLYVGMKYNLLFGFFIRDGSFDIQIPINTKTIDKVILIGGQSEETIYEKGGPQGSQ